MPELPPRSDSPDDVVVQLRVRRRNLDALTSEAGVFLGHDELTGGVISQRLVPLGDGTYGLEVVTNAIAMAMAPDAVEPREVPPDA